MKNQHSTNLNFTERTRKRQYTTKNQITVIVGRLKLMAFFCKNFKKGTIEDEMAGWHHGLDGHESE